MTTPYTVNITYGAEPAGQTLSVVGTPLTFIWGSATPLEAEGVTFTEGADPAVAVDVSWSWAGFGGFYMAAGNDPSTFVRFLSGTNLTYWKAYIGGDAPSTAGDAYLDIGFLNTAGVEAVWNSITPVGGTPTEWAVSSSALGAGYVRATYTGPTTPTTVLWVAAQFVGGDQPSFGYGVTQSFSSTTASSFGIQAVAADTTSMPLNCLTGATQVCLVDVAAPAALNSLGPGPVQVHALQPDGSPIVVPAWVVRGTSRALVSKGHALVGAGQGAAASWSHVLLAPRGTVRRRPVEEWRCGSCRTAGAPVEGCGVCWPVVVAGFDSVAACDAAEDWLPPVIASEEPWYHLVPVDVEAHKGCAFRLPNGMLSEFFRTPLDKVLASGRFTLADA
jgi:hypothetical protein